MKLEFKLIENPRTKPDLLGEMFIRWDKIIQGRLCGKGTSSKSRNRRSYNPIKRVKKSSCCSILNQHHEILKNDPERLTTEFIKSLSRCECNKV